MHRKQLNKKMKPHPNIIFILLNNNKLMLIISMVCSLSYTKDAHLVFQLHEEKKVLENVFWGLLNDFNAI